MHFHVVIPARHASLRLPGKPLLDIAGKPMVVRVVERAMESGAATVSVATDHPEIAAVVAACGYDVVMTCPDHATGTDRIAEVVQLKGWSDEAIVINVQGDEPLIAPSLIRDVAQNLAEHTEAAMATACHLLHDRADMLNPNAVKVVIDRAGHAMYFSRAPIPYPRAAFAGEGGLPAGLPAYRHIGIYAYRAGFLRIYTRLPSAPIEVFESLEQLRALWHGYKISIAITAAPPAAGVDTTEDLERVRRFFADEY